MTAPIEGTIEETRKALDALTPERTEELATAIAEQWQRDWGVVLALVVTKTGLSRSNAYQYMMLREMAMIRSALERSLQPSYHDNCEGCKNAKQFHEDQWKALRLTIEHLENELGDDWKDEV